MAGLPPTLTVCTGWSAAGYRLYGRRFVEGFNRFWPATVDLVAYVEEPCDMGRHSYRLLSEIPGCMEFLDRHRGKPMPNGRLQTASWKENARSLGYNWRFDAWKFSRQGFIPWHAAQRAMTPLLCWLDGDVVTTAAVADQTIEKMLPADKAIAYLGREPKHPDIAFQLYRIIGRGGAFAQAVLHRFSQLYASDAVFELPEWHSAYVWKHVVDRTDPGPGATPPVYNLTPGGHGHVWQQSPLRAFSDHLKGNRKGYEHPEQRA